MREVKKSRIVALIEKGEIKQAINFIKLSVSEKEIVHAKFTPLFSQYNHNNMFFLQGLIDYQRYELSYSRIVKGIIDSVIELEESELADYTIETNKRDTDIIEPLLVLTQSPKQVDILKNIFFLLHFKNVDIQVVSESFKTEVDLIVFDNMDLPAARNLDEAQKAIIKVRTDLMDDFLQKNHSYILHYGPMISWLDDAQKRLRVSAANSPITLYSRIMEALRFIDAFRI